MTKLEWREIAPPCEKSRTCVCPSHFTLLQSDSVSVLACQLQLQILDVWTFDLVSSKFLDARIHDILFSAKFCDLVQTLETLTTLPT